MSIAKRMGRSVTVLTLGLSLSLAACQSSAVSSKLAPSDPLVDGHSTGTRSSIVALDVPQVQPIDKAAAKNDSPASGLANHLSEIGAQMFGAYWCPHCQEQKKKFGDAFSTVDYVECDPGGENPRTQLCLDSNIEAFPTWVINDEHHLGVHSLAELAELSGYEGEI